MISNCKVLTLLALSPGCKQIGAPGSGTVERQSFYTKPAPWRNLIPPPKKKLPFFSPPRIPPLLFSSPFLLCPKSSPALNHGCPDETPVSASKCPGRDNIGHGFGLGGTRL
ncbi:UNVERIFIED_CONTAM: hypothetical protein FKN15_010974 [Acipenser sinensis]